MAAPEIKKGITEEQLQELDDVFARAKKALAIIETYDQARVDRLCRAVAWAVANKQTFTRLVDMGIAESGLGDAVSRMGKRMKIRGVLRDALREKSVGIIEELPAKGIVKYGKPAGIIACIVPTTNPDLTPAGNAIIEASIFDKLLKQLQVEGGYLASDVEKAALRRVMWDADGHRTSDTVAVSPQKLARAAGFAIPTDRKFIIVHGDGIGQEH